MLASEEIIVSGDSRYHRCLSSLLLRRDVRIWKGPGSPKDGREEVGVTDVLRLDCLLTSIDNRRVLSLSERIPVVYGAQVEDVVTVESINGKSIRWVRIVCSSSRLVSCK